MFINKIKPILLSFLGLALPIAALAINPGTYQLKNHPDGNAAPPLYGLRLDHLYDVAGDANDRFTFDFDHASSSMFLDYDGTDIRIHGTAFGGYDAGTTYDPNLSGLWDIDFTYENVNAVAGDDDVGVLAGNTPVNVGSIEALFSSPDNLIEAGDTFFLSEYAGNHPYTFRFGDEDNDAGHRGFAGLSGWGWLNISDDPLNPINPNHLAAQDWLFAAVPVPEPGTYLLMGTLLGGAALMLNRRTRQREKQRVRCK